MTTGAASMKASPAPGGTPLANSRRVRNTTPHSQHGVAAPRASRTAWPASAPWADTARPFRAHERLDQARGHRAEQQKRQGLEHDGEGRLGEQVEIGQGGHQDALPVAAARAGSRR
jgi:hypothetical protein